MALTQNLSGCERVYPTASRTERPKVRQLPPDRPRSILCSPTPNENGRPLRNIPTVPRRRVVEYFGSRSDFTTAEATARRADERTQRRTDTLMASLIPYVGADGRVVRGAWMKRVEVE